MTLAPERVALLLPASSPAEWVSARLAARPTDGDAAGRTPWLGVDDVLADRAVALREAHGRLVAGGATPAAAAKWVVADVAGGVAGVVGLALATASAGLLVRARGPRWRFTAGGRVDAVDPGPVGAAVTPGHSWAGQDGVDVLDDEAAVAAAAVGALVAAVDPVVEACRGLAAVGRGALWAEVGDAFGLAVTYSPELPVDEAAAARLRAAVAAGGAPWRALPDLRVAAAVDPDGVREEYVGRKGGCCLAYRCQVPPRGDDELTDRERAHRERFPLAPGAREHCSDCSLRDLADCEDRQLFWLRQERDERSRHLP